MAERLTLRKGVYGGTCPDPKGYGCGGVLKTVEEVVGGDPATLKHPMWLMCPKCKSRFDRDGRWVDWRGLYDQPPLLESSEPITPMPQRGEAGEIPW